MYSFFFENVSEKFVLNGLISFQWRQLVKVVKLNMYGIWTTLSPSASTLETREEGRAGSLTCSWWGQVSTFSLYLGTKPG